MSQKRKKKKGGFREGSGRPTVINPDEKFWRDAEELANMQCTQEEIAGFLKISPDTFVTKIKQHYGIDYSEWSAKYSYGGRACLRRRLYHQAMSDGKDSVKAAIWLSKNYLGMKDNHEVAISAQKPIQFAYSLNEESEID